MLDNEAIQAMKRALAFGDSITALSFAWRIIPWGSDCCHGCENYQCGHTITAHGFCPIQQRRVSPHYYCGRWEQD